MKTFPHKEIGAIVKAQGRDPQITDDFIEELLYTPFDDRQAFTILALLAPNLDYKNGDFNKDHLHPKSAFERRKLSAVGLNAADLEFYGDERNSILNLRFLDANENKSKLATDLADWVRVEAQRQKVTESKFCLDRQLPNPATLAFGRFREFIAERKKILGQELRSILQ
jgi:hypothetical protein